MKEPSAGQTARRFPFTHLKGGLFLISFFLYFYFFQLTPSPVSQIEVMLWWCFSFCFFFLRLPFTVLDPVPHAARQDSSVTCARLYKRTRGEIRRRAEERAVENICHCHPPPPSPPIYSGNGLTLFFFLLKDIVSEQRSRKSARVTDKRGMD